VAVGKVIDHSAEGTDQTASSVTQTSAEVLGSVQQVRGPRKVHRFLPWYDINR
jgi:hypothetical protein